MKIEKKIIEYGAELVCMGDTYKTKENAFSFSTIKELKEQLGKDIQDSKYKIEWLVIIFDNSTTIKYANGKMTIYAMGEHRPFKILDVTATPRHLLHYIQEEKRRPF